MCSLQIGTLIQVRLFASLNIMSFVSITALYHQSGLPVIDEDELRRLAKQKYPYRCGQCCKGFSTMTRRKIHEKIHDLFHKAYNNNNTLLMYFYLDLLHRW